MDSDKKYLDMSENFKSVRDSLHELRNHTAPIPNVLESVEEIKTKVAIFELKQETLEKMVKPVYKAYVGVVSILGFVTFCCTIIGVYYGFRE